MATCVQLRGLLNGEFYTFPPIGNAPHFLIPCEKWNIEDLLNNHLVLLKALPNGGYEAAYEKLPDYVEKTPIISHAPVRAIIEPNGTKRICGSLLGAADESGVVNVYFGTEKVYEQAENIDCMDVEGIPTPTTPSTPPPSPPPTKTRRYR